MGIALSSKAELLPSPKTVVVVVVVLFFVLIFTAMQRELRFCTSGRLPCSSSSFKCFHTHFTAFFFPPSGTAWRQKVTVSCRVCKNCDSISLPSSPTSSTPCLKGRIGHASSARRCATACSMCLPTGVNSSPSSWQTRTRSSGDWVGGASWKSAICVL